MKFEELSGRELLKFYKGYVHNCEIDASAPKEAKKAFEIAKARGQKKLELWKRGIRIDTL